MTWWRVLSSCLVHLQSAGGECVTVPAASSNNLWPPLAASYCLIAAHASLKGPSQGGQAYVATAQRALPQSNVSDA
jgi:hypothetical protein